MLDLPSLTEKRLIQAADAAGLKIAVFLDQLLEQYQIDRYDVEQAERALQEPGEITSEELKAKYGL